MDLAAFSPACLLLLLSLYQLATGRQADDVDGDWSKSKYMEEVGQTFNLVFIINKYEAKIRPPESILEVNLEVTLKHIHHLLLSKQELQTVVDVKIEWTDTRLSWFPRRVFHIVVPSKEVWLPDIVYTNLLRPSQSLYPPSLRISSRGEIVWNKKEMLSTYCRTNADEERQYCSIDLGFLSGLHDRVFTNTSTLILPEDFTNTDWRLMEAGMSLGGDENTTDASTISVDLVLERKVRGSSSSGQGADRSTDVSYSTDNEDPGCCQTDGLQGNGNNGSKDGAAYNDVNLLTLTLLTVAAVTIATKPVVCLHVLS